MNIILMIPSILILTKLIVKAYGIRTMSLYNLKQIGLPRVPLTRTMQPSMIKQQCYFNNMLIECAAYPMDITNNIKINMDRQRLAQEQLYRDIMNTDFKRTAESARNIQTLNQPPTFRRMLNQNPVPNLNMFSLHGKSDGYALPNYTENTVVNGNNKLNMKLDSQFVKRIQSESESNESEEILTTRISSRESSVELEMTTATTFFPSPTTENSSMDFLSEQFEKSLHHFERKFYGTTFSKLRSISPISRRENGMSYVQSGLFLQLAMMALSTEVDPETRIEIDECLDLHVPDKERIQLIDKTLSSLPMSSDNLKFRWSTRLVLQSQTISDQFRANVAPALRLQIHSFNGTETPKEMAVALNHMVEIDSGGAIHNTFEEEDVSEGVRAVLITTVYLRARWRSAPTLLNGSRPFHDSEGPPARTVRMIRVNDVMRYADLPDWNAEALEIFYSTPGLTLLMLVPRGNSLRSLADKVATTGLGGIAARMQPLRIAATLPLYTLRMTLLLPNKLEAMNMSRIVDTNTTQSESFRLSHAVQRIMFWAEAGRNAFKDDGIEWDEAPQREIVVDRPYIFYVRWKNKTLMNGNFVL